MTIVRFIQRSPLSFQEYVFQLLAFAGAGAFYCSARRFGIPRFLPQITFLANITETPAHGAASPSTNNLKLKAPEVSPFNGDSTSWYAWKTSTISALTSTGYHVVLDPDFDASLNAANKAKNNVVYAVLVKAVSGGHAEWHVMQFKKDLDGYSSWRALVRRFEGEGMQNQLASTLRNVIRSIHLLPGTSASEYINTFMLNFNKLKELEGHAMTEAEGKTLFLEGILHQDFKPTRESLSLGLDDRSLLELVDAIQQKDLSLDRIRSDKVRTRRAALAYGYIPPPPTSSVVKYRRVSKLPEVIHPNLDNFIYIPQRAWTKLEDEDKSFVRVHNRALRHKKRPPPPPEGITIGDPKDDGTGNGDVLNKREYKLRRCRRKYPQVHPRVDGLPPPPPPALENQRRVMFHLEDTVINNDDGGDTRSATRRVRHVRFRPLFEDSEDEVSSLGSGSSLAPEVAESFNDLDNADDQQEAAIKLEDDPDPPEEPFDYPSGYIGPLRVKSEPDLDDNTVKQFTDNDDGINIPSAGDSKSLDHAASDPYLYSLTSNDSLTFYSEAPKRTKRVCDGMTPVRRNKPEQKHRFVLDSGGGKRPTVHQPAWHICGGQPGLTATLSPYQSNQTFTHPVVTAITKATVTNLHAPVLFKVNYATLITTEHDPNEHESLLTTWDLHNFGHVVEGIHPKAPKCGITIQNTFMELDWDDETVFFSISCPTQEDLDTYDIYELNSPLPDPGRVRRLASPTWDGKFKKLPMSELRKRFAYLPEDIIKKSLDNTTQYYLEVLEENQDNPQKHFRKRFKAIPDRRQHEEVATDYVYFSKKSSSGHNGGQFFCGVTSKRWEFFPLRKESHNLGALQDYIRKLGPPTCLVSDNAKSEIGASWSEVLRTYMVQTRTSEPHHPHQNPAEPEWGRLGNMIKNVLRQSQAPIGLCNWVTLYCCQVNNHTSRRSLNFRTPMEVSTGHTPDISKFRFYFYEPLWYFEPKIKLPRPNLLKCRYLGIAESCGDAMTYYVLTEPDDPKAKRQVLMRSVVKSRRKDIGTTSEYVNDNPDMESFTISLSESLANVDQHETFESTEVPLLVPGEKISEAADLNTTNSGELDISNHDEQQADLLPATVLNDNDEQLPTDINATNDAESFQAIVERMHTDVDSDCQFRKIVNHGWTNGTLIMKAQYSDTIQGTFEIDTPFKKLKIDEPLSCAKYIRDHIIEPRRGDRPLNDWADRTIKQHSQIARRMMSIQPTWKSPTENQNTSLIRSSLQSRLRRKIKALRLRRNGPSRNQRWIEKLNKEKFGIKIPNTAAEALKMDSEAGNTKWHDAIKKEMDNLNRLDVFKYHPPTKEFPKSEGWQKAPLRMIYDIKNEDQRYKARLVIGGHKVDSTGYNTYSSQVDGLSVLLLLLTAQHSNLSIMTCDVSNAFVTAPNSEKVWAVAGDEFGEKKGCKLEIQRALYGLAGSARAFADFFADTLIRLGFEPSRADPDLWIKKTSYGYDYIATHVDDVIVASKTPGEYMARIEQEYALRNIETDPSYYLGSRLKRRPDGKLQMNMEEYCKETIRKYESKHNITLKKENIPMPVDSKPETDTSEILDEAEHKDYQHIVGICQWLVIRGRIDITYAVSSLSRFSTCPRKGHHTLAKKILGYLKKYPKKGIVIDPTPPRISEYPNTPPEKFEEFGHQYHYFKEQHDPRFPTQTIPELDVTIFCDADHGHDLVTGRSITGILAFVGSTPVYWKSTRQTSVQTSTFGSEFTALKKAVEVAITIRYHLRSMGIKVEKPTKIFVDNKSVFLNIANPASTLNKKAIALAYHFVREHQAGGVIEALHIKSEDNYSDCLTKALNSTLHSGLIYEFMTN